MAKEKRLIDANVLMDEVDKSKYDNPHTTSRVKINHYKEHDHFLRMIFEAPTVDAVEVVRCKACDWYRKDGSICVNPKCGKSWYGCRVPEQHYCSYGERKDNG